MGALFSMPKPSPTVRMPDMNSPAVLEAQRKKQREIGARSGRDSTMLTRNGSGTQAYQNSLLGQAG